MLKISVFGVNHLKCLQLQIAVPAIRVQSRHREEVNLQLCRWLEPPHRLDNHDNQNQWKGHGRTDRRRHEQHSLLW